jgi:hypothetical protein
MESARPASAPRGAPRTISCGCCRKNRTKHYHSRTVIRHPRFRIGIKPMPALRVLIATRCLSGSDKISESSLGPPLFLRGAGMATPSAADCSPCYDWDICRGAWHFAPRVIVGYWCPQS